MAIINDPVNAMDWAYKGYQYPLPKAWKYVIRVQDQIQWLLQGLMCINDYGINQGDLTAALKELQAQWLLELEHLQNELMDALKAATAGGYVHNPMTGCNVLSYVAAKQTYDALRTHAMTFEEFAAYPQTYAQLATVGRTYLEIDMFANDYFGDGQARAKFTPEEHVEVNSPGYGKEA